MKLIYKSIFTLFLVASFSSCTEYLDVNTNPNSPTADVVTPDLILPAAQNGSYSALVSQSDYGMIIMNQTAGDVTNYTGGNASEYRFNLTAGYHSGIWNNLYLVTDKLQGVIRKNSSKYSNYTAIAKILKSHNMQYIVDMYGDAPYSNAFKRGSNYQPTYDSAKDIYVALFDNLTDAISMINSAPADAENPGSNDVMLNGNMTMWKKFANTLRLKLLVRAASSTDAAVQTWVNASFPLLAGTPFLGPGESITINPGYAAGSGTQNPFFNSYGLTSTGNKADKFTVASQYFVDFLMANGNATPTAVFDKRITAFFDVIRNGQGGQGAYLPGEYQGIVQGADDPIDVNKGLSFPRRLGQHTTGNNPNAVLYPNWEDNMSSKTAILRSASQDGLFFSDTESLLLQAEAAMNGKIAGNAQTFFENAITSSFTYYGLAADAPAYITGISAINGVGWTGSNTDKLEAIMTQKWVALFGVDASESMIEHNRTGFPNPPLPTLTTETHRPYRLLYPSSEVNGNSGNVPSVVKADAFTASIFYQH